MTKQLKRPRKFLTPPSDRASMHVAYLNHIHTPARAWERLEFERKARQAIARAKGQ